MLNFSALFSFTAHKPYETTTMKTNVSFQKINYRKKEKRYLRS